MSDEQPSDKELAEAAALARALDGAPLAAADELPRDALEVAALMRLAQPGAALDEQRAEAVLTGVLGPVTRRPRTRWVWGGLGVASSFAVAALCLLMLRSQAPRELEAKRAPSVLAPQELAAAAPSGGAPVPAVQGVAPAPAQAEPKLEAVQPEATDALARLARREKRGLPSARKRADMDNSESAKQVTDAPAPPSAAAVELAAADPNATARGQAERGQYEGVLRPLRARPAELDQRQEPAAEEAPAVYGEPEPADVTAAAPKRKPAASAASARSAGPRLLEAQLQIEPNAAGSMAALERAQAEYRGPLLQQLKAAAVGAAHTRADAALARGQADQALQTLEATFAAALSGKVSSELLTDLAFRAAALALRNGDAERALRDAARGVACATANDPSLVSLWRVRAQAERTAGAATAAAVSDGRAQRILQRLRAQ